MPVLDPVKKSIAQSAKSRHGYICRKCKKKFRRHPTKTRPAKCPRCGSKEARMIDHGKQPKR